MVRVIFCHSATFSFEVISPQYLPPLILNHSLFSSMTSVLLSPSLQQHPMNLSLPVTLTFISIILQTLSPLSFCLFSPFNLSQHVHFPTHDKNRILDLVITSSDTSLAPVVFFSPIGFHPTTTPSSNTSLFPSATLHRRWFFPDRPEILSAHNWSPKITWTSPVRFQHHSIFSAWQTRSHRHQTLQAPVSIKPLVFTARCYASAVLAMALCLSVCLSVRRKSVFY